MRHAHSVRGQEKLLQCASADKNFMNGVRLEIQISYTCYETFDIPRSVDNSLLDLFRRGLYSSTRLLC